MLYHIKKQLAQSDLIDHDQPKYLLKALTRPNLKGMGTVLFCLIFYQALSIFDII